MARTTGISIANKQKTQEKSAFFAEQYPKQQIDHERKALLEAYTNEYATEIRAEAQKGVDQMRAEIRANELKKYKEQLRAEVQDD